MGAQLGCLREAGWSVVGQDLDKEREDLALEMGAIDRVGTMDDVDIAFVATPVSNVVASVRQALDEGAKAVTDVGSVKGSIVQEINSPLFIPGHPMAGSEQEGIRGARGDLWGQQVLTPAEITGDHFAKVRAVIVEIGADVVVIDADAHDELVAVVSHVPHLTAGALEDR